MIVGQETANELCKFCNQPRGYGNHELYCSQNPDNLARTCSQADSRCNGPGNHVTDHGYSWVCDYHNELEIRISQMSSAHGKVIYLVSRIRNLENELAELSKQLPDARSEEVVARQRFEDFRGKV